MSVSNNFFYTKDHEWVSAPSNSVVTVGVSQYALEQLGDIVYIELPEVGKKLSAGDSFGTIESTKTVSDLYVPEDGVVSEVNNNIVKNPELIQEDPYNQGWLIKFKLTKNITKTLMSLQEYKSYIQEI